MGHLALSLLGTFQVRVEGQPVVHFRSANTQALLVYLALQSERAIPRDVLAALFWPEESEKNASNNLRQSLYQLRRLLGDGEHGDGESHLLITRQTVQFHNGSDHDIDVVAFLRAIQRHDLEEAAAIYRGELLPGFSSDSLEFEEWLRLERERLHRLALEAMTEAAQAHLQQGRLDRVQELARRQLALEPWHEAAHRQLMSAYALAGDRVAALAQYHRCLEQLEMEMGLEPAPETVALYEEIRSGRYGPMAIAGEATLRPPERVRHNLPAETMPFYGRELELAQLQRLLLEEKRRLVTIVGPGGMGKTRLALAVGAALVGQYADGVTFVDLSRLSDVEEIGPAIGAALAFQAPDPSQETWPQLLRALGSRQQLLILDNFEHLLDGAPLVNELLLAGPDLSLLVTSRQRLNLTTESLFELQGLETPETLTIARAMNYTAVQLFVESGRRVRRGFTLDEENVVDVVRICQLVQGMPLALVLAAAWLELLAPAEIVAEIRQSLYFLEANLADLPPRQRSMRTVFMRSWQMMTPEQQRVLARLSVFCGGFTREAAQAVSGADLRLLLALTNKSMLQRQAESGRFTIHELLRQFAAEQGRPQSDEEEESALLAHCRYFAQLMAVESQPGLGFYSMHVPWRFAADRENLYQAWHYAVEHGLAQELAQLARAVASMYFAQGVQPGPHLQKALLALQERGVPETDRSMLHLRHAWLNSRSGVDDYQRLRQRFLEFAPLVEEHGDWDLRYWLWEDLSSMDYFYHEVWRRAGHYEEQPEMLQWAEKAYEAAQEMGPEAVVHVARATVLSMRLDLNLYEEGDPAELAQLLRILEPNYPDEFILFRILTSLTGYYRSLQEYERAMSYGKRGLHITKLWQDLFWISLALDTLADIALNMGRPDEAAAYQMEGLEWHLATGQVWQTLGFIWSKAVYYPQLLGGAEAAVPMLAMVYHHPECVPYHQPPIREGAIQFVEALGEERFEALWQQGRELKFERVVEQMRAAFRPRRVERI